jgi:hypothetical protein
MVGGRACKQAQTPVGVDERDRAMKTLSMDSHFPENDNICHSDEEEQDLL